MDSPAQDWPFLHGPRLPLIYNRIVFAFQAANDLRLVDTVHVKRGERVTYESRRRLVSLIHSRARMAPLLESDAGVALATASILRQLASVEK